MSALLPCVWNPAKTWVVTKTSQGKYYLNQMINGQMIHSRSERTTKYGVSEATCRTRQELNQLFS